MLNVEICQKVLGRKHDNIQKQFAYNLFDLEDTPANRDILRVIERGTYLNKREFIDRFGYRCLVSDCSSGSIAAFLVANTDLTVDLAECGNNARDYILTHFNRGSVIIYESATPIAMKPVPVDIQLRNYHITDSDRFSYYLRYEFPGRPDLNLYGESKGIEVLDWKQPWGEDAPEDRVSSMLIMLWAHPEAESDSELIHALETETGDPNLDWNVIRADLWESGIRFRPDCKDLPKETPLAIQQCIHKILEKNGSST